MTDDGKLAAGDLVARNVRRYRRERRMSLGELARRSALSKQTLSKIEHGLGNPTIDTLMQIGTALEIPAHRLLTEWGSPVFIRRADPHQPKTASYQRTLDEVYGSGYVRTKVLHLTREANADHATDLDLPGTLLHLYMISGKLQTGPLVEPVTLSAGDFVRFPGDMPYTYECRTAVVIAHLVTTVPQLHQFEAFD